MKKVQVVIVQLLVGEGFATGVDVQSAILRNLTLARSGQHMYVLG